MSIPDSAVRYWSKILAGHLFNSEEEARIKIFDICESHARQSWSAREDDVTVVTSRNFANAMPIHRAGGKWKVGPALQEYLTMTPDMSDRSHGEPGLNQPSAGDGLTAVGVPDYKYLERTKRRHQKLRALQMRRDPDSVSTNPVDQQIADIVKETLEDEDDVKEIDPDPDPDYSKLPEYHFGWSLSLGSEDEIRLRAFNANIRLGTKTWELINEDYITIEKNVLRSLNHLPSVVFTEQGHSGNDGDLVGAGWIVPSQAPGLWRTLSFRPGWIPVRLLDFAHFTRIRPEDIYADTEPAMRKL